MAKESPSPTPAYASSFPVFVDSSIDTHLAMVVAPDDAVADLKRKIRIEHAICFPNVGEITIQAIKVKRRSSFYHLSDSMLVRSAFDGIKGTWFVNMDASSVSMVKGLAETAENVGSKNVEQAEKHDQLHVEPNVSFLLGCSSDKFQGVVDEKQSLLETSVDRGARHGNSSLPNARICQIDSVQVSSHDQIDMGDTNADASRGMNLREEAVYEPDRIPDVTDMHEEQACKVVEEVGPQEQSKTSLVGGQEEKYGGVEGCQNPDVGASDGGASIVATKKRKSSRRSHVSVNSLIMDVDLEHLSREKKKHKKEKDVSFKESLLQAPAARNNFERPLQDKETTMLENIPPGTNSQEKILACSVELSGKLPQGDLSLPENLTNDKRERKKKKRSSKSHKEVVSAVPSNNCNTSLSHRMEEPHTKIGPSDNLGDISGAVVPVGEQAIKGNAVEVGVNNYRSLTKEPDAAVCIEEATENFTEEKYEDPLDHSHKEQGEGPNVLDGSASLANLLEVGPEVQTNSFCRRKKSKNELTKSTASKFYPSHASEHLNKKNPYEASGDNCRDLNEESDSATISKEFGDPNKVANLDIEVPSSTNIRSSHHRRKKNTKKAELTNLQPSKNGITHPSGDQVVEDNYKEMLYDHHRELGKESGGATILREVVALKNSAVVDSGNLSNIDDRRSNRKSKKSGKSKSRNHEFIQQESAHSLGKEPVEEKPKETLETYHKDLDKESKPTTSPREPAGFRSPSKQDFVIPTNNKDKILHKKKLAKAEHFCNTSSNHDLSSGDQSTRENFEKAFRTTTGESGNTSNAVMLPEDASQNISHGNISKLDSIGWLNDSSNKHETAHHSADDITQENRKELLGNSHEDSVEVNENMDLSKSGSCKTNFDSFLPKVIKHESGLSAKELPLKETENGKLQKHKSKRKRKLNMHSQDSITDIVKPLSSNEQHMYKSKYHDADPGNILTDSMEQLPNKEVETKTTHDKKTREKSSKSKMKFDDMPSIFRPLRNSLDDSRPEKKLQVDKSDTSHQASLSRDEKSMHVHHPKEKTTASDSKLKSHDHQGGTAIVHSMDKVPLPGKMNAVIKGDVVGAPATQSDSADVSCKDAEADLVASSDSTEDARLNKEYRVAVRKVPSKRFGNALNHSKQDKPLLATPSMIFDDATSESTDDKYEISNREDHMKAISDNTSTSADSDGDLEEAQTAGINPAAYGEKYVGTDVGGITLSQSNESKKSMPLGTILRSSSSYKKAKLLASQSQAEDSESQPVDIVLETQPDYTTP